MKTLTIYIGLFLITANIQGCSSTPPSLSSTAKTLENDMRSQGKDNCKTLSVSERDCKFN